MLPLGRHEVLHRAVGTLIPPFSGSLKWAERRALSLVVSSVAGSLQKGASLLTFHMDMNISFSCTLGGRLGQHGDGSCGPLEFFERRDDTLELLLLGIQILNRFV